MSILKSSFTLRPSTSDLKMPSGGENLTRNQPSPSSFLPHGANRLSLDGGIRIYFEALSQLSFNKKAAFCHPGCNYHDDDRQIFRSIEQEDGDYYENQDLSEGENDAPEDCETTSCYQEQEDKEDRITSSNVTLSRNDIEDTSHSGDTRDNVSSEKYKCLSYSRNDKNVIILSDGAGVSAAQKDEEISYEGCTGEISRALQHDYDECKKRKASCDGENDVAVPVQRRRLQKVM